MLRALSSSVRVFGARCDVALFAQRAMSSAPDLSGPVKVANMDLKHRVVMASMTRCRNAPGTEAPRELNALYYSQRASDGGLILSECIAVSPSARGYVRAPGLYTQAQFDGWKMVVDRVHQKGGYFFAQLFHPGRVSHSSLLPPGRQCIAPSAIKMDGQLYVDGGKKVDFEMPKEATEAELAEVVRDHANAAKAAVELCGFDGVDIHAGNGYLLQQFTSKVTNHRTDKYGGSVENKCRLLLETVDAISAAIGSHRTSIKLWPGATFSELVQPEDEAIEMLNYLGPELSKRNLAFVCLTSTNGDPYYKYMGMSKPHIEQDLFKLWRSVYTGKVMINGGVSIEGAREYVKSGTADMVAYGIHFLANANLPALVKAGYGTGQLNMAGWNNKTWFGMNPADDEKGYTDFPLVEPVAQKA